jgi:predicted negative regulator of RcsB-dependent stress response
MKDIIDEIKEDLKQETFLKLVKKYGKNCLLGAFIIVFTVVAYVSIKQKYVDGQEELSLKYYKLLEQSTVNNQSEYQKILDTLTKQNGSLFGQLAAFEQINNLVVKEKEYDKAVGLLLKLLTSRNKEITNIAKIRAAELTLRYNLVDHKQKVISALKKTNPKEPFADMISFFLAQMLIEDNQKEEAITILTRLNDNNNTSEGIRFFANTILSST